MKAVHFGAGNIGRGFIGEVLATNGFEITFFDANDDIVKAIHERGEYTIEFASERKEEKTITNIDAINNVKNPEAVVESISKADIVTTAIGPKVLPFIAELIAKGIQKRKTDGNEDTFDVVACENMIGGTDFLKSEVDKYLTDEDQAFISKFVGFPNAAVDRIVPQQHNEDILKVSVEPFKEWVLDESQVKSDVRLDGVLYVPDLEPYIERKLLSVNTGHATVAYIGNYNGYEYIVDAMENEEIVSKLKAVLGETSNLLIHKWNFEPEVQKNYASKIVERFSNPSIRDEITRVGRTPIRKLGFNERFIKPIRELKEYGLDNSELIDAVGYIFYFDHPEDDESVQLLEKKAHEDLETVISEVTGLEDQGLIEQIETSVKNKEK